MSHGDLRSMSETPGALAVISRSYPPLGPLVKLLDIITNTVHDVLEGKEGALQGNKRCLDLWSDIAGPKPMEEEHDEHDLVKGVDVPSVGVLSAPHVFVSTGKEVNKVDGIPLKDPHLLWLTACLNHCVHPNSK